MSSLCQFLLAQAPTAEYLVRIHNVSTAEMNAISNVDTGSLIYNLDSLQLFQYNGSLWKAVGKQPSIDSLVFKMDSLRLYAFNSKYVVSIPDTDSTNELQQLSVSNDTLYLSKGNSVYLGSSINIDTVVNFFTTTTQAVTGRTMTTVNGLQFNYFSGKKYRFKVYLVYNTSNTSNGIRIAMNSVSGNVWYDLLYQLNTTGATDYYSGFNSTVTQVANSSPNLTNNVAVIEGTIHATSNGTFSFQFAAEANNGTTTIQPNSLLEYEVIN